MRSGNRKRKRPVSEQAKRATTRNRKLECDAGCGYCVRVSARWMRTGLPTCPCGGTLWPAELADACEVLPVEALAEHPAWTLYESELASIDHGRKGTGHGTMAAPLAERKTRDGRMTAEALAAHRVHLAERGSAVERRLAALRGPSPSVELPF